MDWDLPIGWAISLVGVWLTGWVLVVLALLSWHYRRWVAYHHLKGMASPPPALRVLQVEAVDSLRLVVDFLRGLFRDGLSVPRDVRGRLVVCVHGYTQNGTNFVRIREALEEEGRPTMAVSLLHRLAPLPWYLKRLEKELERAVLVQPGGIDVVCHSMGGVLLRAVLARRPDLADQVHRVVTLGTPHRGTAAARGIPLIPEVQALKRRSLFLSDLPSLPSLVRETVTVAGTLDTIVYPIDSALEEGAGQVVVEAGHAGLLTRPAAVEAVCRAVVMDATSAGASPGG